MVKEIHIKAPCDQDIQTSEIRSKLSKRIFEQAQTTKRTDDQQWC